VLIWNQRHLTYALREFDLPCSFTLPAGATCNDAAPVYRRFSSFSQAAAENAQSRILVGFHFRKAVEVGTAHGDKIGEYTVDRVLRPVR
jgi:hypothetical protein